LPGDLKVSENFSFFGSGGIDWQALNDPNNNPILVACLEGRADESLKPLGVYDVKQRLERLQRGNLIKKVGDRYVLAFPAVVGDKRDRLRTYAEQAARQLMPFGEKIIAQIQPHLAGRDEMLYHVLWSVIMDGGPAWDAARAEMNKKISNGDTSTENKAWLLYPPHPFRVGTNSFNTSYGHMKITWSPNTPGPNVIGRVIAKYMNRLAQAIERNTTIGSAEIKDALGRYGLVDEGGKVRLYTIQSDSSAAKVYMKLGAEFGWQMMAHLDVEKVAGMLDVSSGIAFVIAYHEICWQLLQDLAEQKVLEIPSIVAKSPIDSTDAYQLVSLTVIKSISDPLLDTGMSAEEAQAIEEYRRIKEKVLAGDKYQDGSTPLHAVLTHLSELEQGQTRDYFMGFDIFRAPLPPAEPEEASLWPVYAGDKELADTFILVYSKGKWIWIGNMGSNYDWHLARPAFVKWAREKIGQSVPADGSGKPSATEKQAPGESTDNRVLSLDGKTGYMRVTDSQSLRSFSDAITIEVWVKASSFYADDWAISSIIRKNVASGAENFLMRFRNVDGGLCVQMGLGDLGTLRAPYEFAVNKWYHLAGTYDGQTVTAYVNGQAVASQNLSGRLYIDNSDLYIGKGGPEYLYQECLHGELDEIRIWNVARSQEQIRAAMNASLSGSEEGLVAYWKFDDGTARDLSSHGNDGQLNGDAGIVESTRPALSAPAQEQPGMLLAWWKLDNDANDSAGTNDGTLHGNPEYVDGKVGSAISFDGDDYVDCGNPDLLNFGTGDWTISAWIKTTQSGIEDMSKGTVFANGADGAGGIRYTLAVNEGQTGSITLTADDDKNKVQARSSTAVNDGAWHHVVVMRKAGQLHVYVDGVLDGGGYLPPGYDLSGTSGQNAYIGAITDNDDGSLYKYFVGLIDEVCIIRGSIDADGVGALFSGEDPATVAQTAVIARPAQAAVAQARPRQTAPYGPPGSIEGDWRIVSDQAGQVAVIKIRSQADGTLSAAVVAEVDNETSPAMPLNKVTFENGKLHFEMTANQAFFEGTMKEDGLTIEGQFRQQGQVTAVVLKRMDIDRSQVTPASQEQFQDRTGGKSNIAIALILVLALAGIVAGIV
ncbi:MAG TPA: hypothetical protein DIU00_14835, partial [Phycisphaerales bacterium]|nr:hypothetical protein [Phycisphaerales bacterium]